TMASDSPRRTSRSMPRRTGTATLSRPKVLASPRVERTTSLIAQRLGGIHARGAPAGIEGRHERQDERERGRPRDVERVQVGRQLADVVHLARQDLEVERVLDGGHDHVDVERRDDSRHDAHDGADSPDHGPWTMKTFMMLAGEAPSVRRIAMSGC